MVENGRLYDILWTPDFTEDIFEAVTYIAEELGSPMAAQALFDGVCERLDSQRAMPTSATTKAGKDGSARYIVTYRNWDIYYVLEGDTIKAIGLKHQLQAGGRSVLPRERS